MNEIHNKVVEVARTVFQQPDLELADSTKANDVERWDSLTHIQFIISVEKAFSIKFRNAEIARLQSIGDLKKLVAKHQTAKAA